jgi:hypothetical protein
LKGCDLKKQSQFDAGQLNAILLMTMVYGDFEIFERRKTKPNKANLLVLSAA